MGCATSLPEDEFVPPPSRQPANGENGAGPKKSGGAGAKPPASPQPAMPLGSSPEISQGGFGGGGSGFQQNPLMAGVSPPAGGGPPMSPGSGGVPAQSAQAAFAAAMASAPRPAQGLDADGTPLGLIAHFPKNGPLKLPEYKERLVTSNGTQRVELAGTGCTLTYAYVTQRGYYPEAPDKTNQDSFCVMTNFGGDLEQMFFGVFDGHGEFGTQCSQFARRKVPENFVRDNNFETYPEVAYHNGFVITNQQLHSSDTDDTMSGTTGITTLLRGRTLYTANVGDSRALVAERQGGELVAIDLSSDQTPFRRDECARVRKYGARVLTLDQLEGLKDPNVECWGTEEEDDGDPPRLWAHNGMYPGTAFTRSIGDMAAERIGVVADPEVSIKNLEKNVEFLVLASDGVFEFMSSQTVVNMVASYDDPQEAALAVTAEAYNLWLQYETRTDDITIIVIKFAGMEDQAAPSDSAAGVAKAANDVGTPERNTLTRRQTWGDKDPKQLTSPVLADEDEDDAEYQPPKLPAKTQDEIKMLEDAVKSNFLFSHLNMMQRLLLFNVMVKRHIIPGEVVIRQGERGDHFYVVEEGQFDVLVFQGDAPAELVHTYHATPGQHPSFGELALMYGKPRAATVVARTQGSLWELDRRAFRTVMHKRDPKVIMKLLQNVEVLEPLSIGQLQRMADMMHSVTFHDGDVIVRQGELGSEFYAIVSGEVVCTVRKNPDNESEDAREVLRLGQFQYFGERALVSSEGRGANVIAKGRVELLTISRFELDSLVGTLAEIRAYRESWMERAQVAHEVMLQRAAKSLSAPFSLSSLTCDGVLYTEEVLAVALMAVEEVGRHIVRLVSVSDTVALGHQSQIVRAGTIARTLPTSLFVPPVIKTLRNQAVMADVLLLETACPLSGLSKDGKPLPEDAAQFMLAGAVIALEHMHMFSLVYRGLSHGTLLITKSSEHSLPGYVQVVDLRYAKAVEGRTFSVVGPSEYLAPEVIAGHGATEACDWWALGVLAYWMMHGATPFARPGDDDLRICKRVQEYRAEDLNMPPSISPNMELLLAQLLQPDPLMRLGTTAGCVKAIKAHPFFEGVDWEALMDGTLPPPDSLVDMLEQWDDYTDPSCFNPQPYSGDTSWLDTF
eukprot:jgi/Tetstr1/433887/TSEL_023067.t1